MFAESSAALPPAFHAWSPLVQAGSLFLGTFVLEDVAAIGAGVLIGTGTLAWPTAFWACFLGIWIGDAGLYALARAGGRGWFERSRYRRFAGRVQRGEEWFARRGNLVLLFSRLLPGARLPTYLAAGFLRVRVQRFLLITGVASLLWTIAILMLASRVGGQLVDWLRQVQFGFWAFLIGLILVGSATQLVRRINWRRTGGRLVTWTQRWTRWEFWPGWLFYPPVVLQGLWLAVKYRGLTLPTAANPGIFSGGLVGESKMATLRDLSASSLRFTAEAELVTGATVEERTASLRDIIRRRQFSYPLVLKPDLGQRGAGVRLLRQESDAIDYFSRTDAPLIAQRHAPGPHEVGIFYYRFPHESQGRIFAITEKIFPSVTGDGHSTVAELIHLETRARIIAGKYLARLGRRSEEVLAVGEQLRLVQAGNHAQGCIFQDGARFHTPELAARIDEISRRVPGFFVGRYDIRFTSEADLCAGRDFQIIELNGAAAEATSIYDARNTLRQAYQTLFRQWEIVFAIGAANRARGATAMTPLEVWRAWRDFASKAATYPAAD